MGSFYNIKILYGIKFANSRVIDYLIFRLITQNEFLFCKAAEGGDAVASLTDNNAADGNSGKSFGEMETCRNTSVLHRIRTGYPR